MGPFGLYDPRFEHDACGVAFVVDVQGRPAHGIVHSALEVLERLAHRGAAGRDPHTGDGAGILMQVPHAFLAAVAGVALPPPGDYAVGTVFLPPDAAGAAACAALFAEVVEAEDQALLAWRDVPIDPRDLGAEARASLPIIRQVFIGRRRCVPSAFERTLFVIRRQAELRVRAAGVDPGHHFHLASLSAETLVWKGMLLGTQLRRFFPELGDPRLTSALAVVHARFSTNTFPSWGRAQPLRYVAHNGEINTVGGNRAWMEARRRQLLSSRFGGSLDHLWPVIDPDGSDSAQFDNLLELLHLAGRSLPAAMAMMIPEAWEEDARLDAARRGLLAYNAALMEPWDGPAAMVFANGHQVGATLDRNGLRPARWVRTADRVILASEAGVVDLPPGEVLERGRLEPGRLFLVDLEAGRVVTDREVKADLAARHPYQRWLGRNVIRQSALPPATPAPRITGDDERRLLSAFGYAEEDLDHVLAPMACEGHEPVGSMGDDTPLAVLSRKAPILFDYFHQAFAQVTNPPIDPIRERVVMSLTTAIGAEGNPFEETAEQCHQLVLDGPILTGEAMARLQAVEAGAFVPRTLSLLYPRADDAAGQADALEALMAEAASAVDAGVNLLILSDRGVDADHLALPALLAVGAVHQHLVRVGCRTLTGLVIETAAAWQVHHMALLIGYGAAAVLPYLALDAIAARWPDGEGAYIGALEKGLLKVMSKMGVSTLQSYRGSGLFEAVGLDAALVARHFTGTPTRLGGVGLPLLHAESLARHARGFAHDAAELPVGGKHRWRRQGEHHQWNPRTIALLQAAVRLEDARLFAAYEEALDAGPELRGLLLPQAADPVPLVEVEPAAEIARRFVTGAMSFGSISAEAHEALAIAMNRLGGRSNSGEGGEEPHRQEPDSNGDSRKSSIRQVASARFGVTTEYLVHAEDIQIKIAQGAKPGEGGQLPGHKVDPRIARVRHSTPGVTLISPPPHHDIYSIEDLAQLIYDLRAVNPQARVSVKLVAQAGIGTVAAGVAKAGADVVVVAGANGGTGASPLSSIHHAGVPWELGLAETQQVLRANGLRDRVRVQVDGGLRTGRDVVVSALLGAEEFGFATAALVSEGCLLLRKCHQNTCSTGIATQDPRLRARFTGTPEQVVRFFLFVAESVRRHLAALGFRSIAEAVGRVDRLAPAIPTDEKARALDLRPLLAEPPGAPPRACVAFVPRDDAGHLDHGLIAEALAEGAGRVTLQRTIRNTDRAVGARLSGEIVRRHGRRGLPEDRVVVDFQGAAGQSFGAFLAPGVTFRLAGETNDGLGKGLSGGRIAVFPPAGSLLAPEEQVITGNAALYGATRGEVYLAGRAGERFAVRNSGARAVVEGVGQHGCEYMTGGVVVVLGPTGPNFAAGMSGGVAYVLDEAGDFAARCNTSGLELQPLADGDEWVVKTLITQHFRHTQSPQGHRLLDQWTRVRSLIVKVIPVEYRRALELQRSGDLKEAS
ncbi:MAG: glutamate synthase large subunit [Myxococcales bacterium]|nr:glutamate synthase large subunit [Myxococcales bacterium]